MSLNISKLETSTQAIVQQILADALFNLKSRVRKIRRIAHPASQTPNAYLRQVALDVAH